MNRARTLWGFLAAALFVAALPAAPAFAQATTGEITGHVRDVAGAAVPGATITARNEGTGLTRTAVTNSVGDYTLTQLPPGEYTVSVELTGFKRAVRNAVPVNVGSRLTLGFDLAVGEISEAVEVTGEAPLIETTKSDLSPAPAGRRIIQW